MTPHHPAETLRKNRERATSFASKVGTERAKKLLERAQRDLERRIARAEGLRGPGKESFTAVHLRVTLEQVKATLRDLKPHFAGAILDASKVAAEQAATGTIDYLQEQELKFRGVTSQPLALEQAAMVDRAVAGTESSVLHRISSDPDDPRTKGILDRYGEAVVSRFEDVLQMRLIARQSWEEARSNLIAQSGFLKDAPLYWAERILRTEVMASSNLANFSTLKQADTIFGDMAKILSATFDDRTCADSFAVHGQIRRTAEPFDTWYGKFMHPPDRPNDREIVVPQRVSWPIPASLEPRSPAEVAARWAKQGRRGPHPPIPMRSTIPLDLFGQPRVRS